MNPLCMPDVSHALAVPGLQLPVPHGSYVKSMSPGGQVLDLVPRSPVVQRMKDFVYISGVSSRFNGVFGANGGAGDDGGEPGSGGGNKGRGGNMGEPGGGGGSGKEFEDRAAPKTMTGSAIAPITAAAMHAVCEVVRGCCALISFFEQFTDYFFFDQHARTCSTDSRPTSSRTSYSTPTGPSHGRGPTSPVSTSRAAPSASPVARAAGTSRTRHFFGTVYR